MALPVHAVHAVVAISAREQHCSLRDVLTPLPPLPLPTQATIDHQALLKVNSPPPRSNLSPSHRCWRLRLTCIRREESNIVRKHIAGKNLLLPRSMDPRTEASYKVTRLCPPPPGWCPLGGYQRVICHARLHYHHHHHHLHNPEPSLSLFPFHLVSHRAACTFLSLSHSPPPTFLTPPLSLIPPSSSQSMPHDSFKQLAFKPQPARPQPQAPPPPTPSISKPTSVPAHISSNFGGVAGSGPGTKATLVQADDADDDDELFANIDMDEFIAQVRRLTMCGRADCHVQ